MKWVEWLQRLPFGRARDSVQSSESGPSPIEQDPARRGIVLLEAGRLIEAVDAFRAAVARAPEQASHRVNLAYALQETGRDPEALVHLQKAVALDESSFDARFMLGSALERHGEPLAASEQLQRAIELRPDFEPAHAQLCRLLAAAGRPEAAREAIDRALALHPDNADLHHYRGNLLLTDGDAAGARVHFERALALRPDYPEVHANLGLALNALQEEHGALESLQRALALNPLLGEAAMNLAAIHKSHGRLDAAAEVLQGFVDRSPRHAEALNQLGIVLQKQGRLDPAIACYERAIELAPDLPGAYGNLGLALYEHGKVGEAITIYRRGLAVQPVASIHDNLAIALQRRGAVDEAIQHYRLALALDPHNVNTRCNLGAALSDGQGPRSAIAAYREILAIRPEHLIAHSNLLFNLTYDQDCSVADYLEEARRFEAKLPREPLPPVAMDPEAGLSRPLRIGLVSGDLRGHPVGFFLEGVLQHLDVERFTLYAYATSPTEDELTARIKPRFAGWRLIKGESDEAAARVVRADRIDILIDLAGHTGQNRLPVFGWRPAPVQVSWLGYFASTGLSAVDYVIADPVCVPEGAEGEFTERVWRLPDTRLCYTPPRSAPPVAPLPARARGYPTFGCFQRVPKINDRVLALWGRVFAAVPDARLLLQSKQFARSRFIEDMLRRLADVGIDASRVTIRPPAHREAYLASYADVDVVLDTFPYTGGTTTCEALWMGVPTLTLSGGSMLGRQGQALLHAAGLSEWVARDDDDYVRKAVGMTTDREALARLRGELREKVRVSPLCDAPRFASHLATALHGMWQERLRAGGRQKPSTRASDEGRATAQ